jgi:hypothetical protein
MKKYGKRLHRRTEVIRPPQKKVVIVEMKSCHTRLVKTHRSKT